MSTTRRCLCALVLIVPLLHGQATAADATLPALERVTVIAVPKAIADFTLTDHNGKARSFATFRGAPTFVFFGFTHCPDICPTVMARMKLLLGVNDGALKAAHMVMISVDGERDTPPIMKQYVGLFSPDFVGLTGDPRTTTNIAARFSAVAYKEQADPKGNYGYFHSTQVFLIDKQGRLRATFSDASLENMAIVTKRVLDE